MEGDPYQQQQQQQYARSQTAPSAGSSTLNHLLSTPSSYAPQMSQQPYYQHPFDPRGQMNQMPMQMYGGAPGGGRNEMNMMQQQGMPDRNAGPGLTDWSQQPTPFPSMFNSAGNTQPQQPPPGFNDPGISPPKKKKRNRSKEKSAASGAPRSSAHQLQQQVLQQQQMQPGPSDMHQMSRSKGPESGDPNFGMAMRPDDPFYMQQQQQQKFYPRPGMPPQQQPPQRPFGMPNQNMNSAQFSAQNYPPPRPPGMPVDLPGQNQFPAMANDPSRMYFQQPTMGFNQPNQPGFPGGPPGGLPGFPVGLPGGPPGGLPESTWTPSGDGQQFEEKTMSSATSAGARSPFSTQNSEASFGENAPIPPVAKSSRPPKPKPLVPPATPQSHSSADIDGDSNSSWAKPNASESGMHTSPSKPNDKLNVLFDMGDEPDRRGFVEALIRLCEEIGSPLVNVPIISKVPLDLYRFYKVIQNRGGYVETQKNKGWKDIAAELGIVAPNPNTAYTLKKQYMKFILPFEARYDRGGVDVSVLIQTAEAAIATGKGPSRTSHKKRVRTTVDSIQENSSEGFDGSGLAPPQLPPHVSFPSQMAPQSEPQMGHQFSQQDMMHHQQHRHQYPPASNDGNPQQPPFWPGHGMPVRPPNETPRGPPFDNFQEQNRLPPPRSAEDSQQHRHPPPPRPAPFPGAQQHSQLGNGFPFNGDRHPMPTDPNSLPEMLGDRRMMNGSTHPAPLPRHAAPTGFPAPEAAMHEPRMSQPIGRFPPVPHPPQANGVSTHLSHSITFPSNSVEATDPVIKMHRKLNFRDVTPWGNELDLWKLHMRLRSGLLAESAWAIDVINIYSSDDNQCHHLRLVNAPTGFLDTILDWFGVTMSRLLKLTAKCAKDDDDQKCNGHSMTKLDRTYFPDGDYYYQTTFLSHGHSDQHLNDNSSPNKFRADAVQANVLEAPHLNLKSEGDAELSRRCLSISTCVRNLSSIPGNELILAKNQRLLYLLGRFITFNHYHIPPPEPIVPPTEPEEELQQLKNHTTSNAFWLQEPLEHVRENLLITLANISGYIDLADSEEAVCRPLLEGLIHWTICSSSSAQDTLSTVTSAHSVGELSVRSLSLEALSKLTVNDSNVDLLIATPSGEELCQFIHQLIQLLPNCASGASAAINYLTREFALVILCSLVGCDERIGQIVAEHQFGIEYLVMLLEEGDRSARISAGTGKLMQMGLDAFDVGATVNSLMLKKAVEILCAIAELLSHRPHLRRWQTRFWDLVVDSRFTDPHLVSGLTRILFLLGSTDELIQLQIPSSSAT